LSDAIKGPLPLQQEAAFYSFLKRPLASFERQKLCLFIVFAARWLQVHNKSKNKNTTRRWLISTAL